MILYVKHALEVITINVQPAFMAYSSIMDNVFVENINILIMGIIIVSNVIILANNAIISITVQSAQLIGIRVIILIMVLTYVIAIQALSLIRYVKFVILDVLPVQPLHLIVPLV